MTSFNLIEAFDTNDDGQVDVVAEYADWDGDEVYHVINVVADLDHNDTFETALTRNNDSTFDLSYDLNKDGNIDAIDYGSNGTIDVVADLNNDDLVNTEDFSIASAAVDSVFSL